MHEDNAGRHMTPSERRNKGWPRPGLSMFLTLRHQAISALFRLRIFRTTIAAGRNKTVVRSSAAFLALVLSIGASPTALASLVGADDFSSLTGFWTPANFNATLAPIGGELAYTTTGGPTANDSVNWFWNQNYGSSAENWSVQIDISLSPAAAVFPTNMNLVVANKSDPDPYGNIFRVELREDFFYADFFEHRNLVAVEFVPTTSLLASLRIAYDAGSGLLEAGYDADGSANGYQFTGFFTQSINQWTITPASLIEAQIYAQTGDLSVTPGMMSFDNFVAQSSPQSVAEPTTLALICLGFGGIPLILRARRPLDTPL